MKNKEIMNSKKRADTKKESIKNLEEMKERIGKIMRKYDYRRK